MRISNTTTKAFLLAAALTVGGMALAPAANAQTDPGTAGAPVPMAMVESIPYAACVPGGPTANDAAIASRLAPQMNGARIGRSLNSYNVSCARIITQTARGRGLDKRAAVIAVTTAITESSLHNYTVAVDYDSLGLFQQRPSTGWGTPSQLVDPVYATNAFLNAMLRKYPNNSWMSGDIGTICQAVQISAYPSAYSREVHDAQLLVDAILASQSPTISATGVVAGDVNGDGRDDLIGIKPDGSMWLYANGGSNTAPYSTGTLIGSAWGQFTKVVAADINADNRDDLIGVRSDGTLWLYLNGGSNSAPYSTGTLIGSAWEQFNTVVAADINADNRDDLVGVKSDGTLWQYLNGGSNSAPFGTGTLIGSAWQQFSTAVAADINGDNRDDLVAVKPDGTLWQYLNGGSNSAPFGTGTLIGSAWQQFNRIVAADINGDGRDDLVTSKADGTLWQYLNGGSNSAPFSTGAQIGTGWSMFR